MSSSPNKRPFSSGGEDEQQNAKMEFESMLKQSQEEMSAKVNATIASSMSENMSKFNNFFVDKFNLLDNRVTSTEEKLSVIESRTDNLEKSQSVKDEKFAQLEAEVEKMRKELCLQKTPDYVAPPVADHFSRPARPDVLSIGVQDHASKDSVMAALKPWLDEVDFNEDSYRLDGPKFGRNFELLFHSPFPSEETAGLRARKANLALQMPNNQWKKLYCKGPEGEDLELFISKDSMPKHKREFTLGKRLFKACERNIGENKGLEFKKSIRAVLFQGKVLAAVECSSFEEFKVQWKPTILAKSELDKAKVLSDFHSRSGITTGESWVV